MQPMVRESQEGHRGWDLRESRMACIGGHGSTSVSEFSHSTCLLECVGVIKERGLAGLDMQTPNIRE